METEIKETKTPQAEKETKKKSSAEQDLYDIVNSDVKISKELEQQWKKDFEEIDKKIGLKNNIKGEKKHGKKN